MKRLIELYQMIYAWHKNLGKVTYLEKYPDHRQDKYFMEYLLFVEKMPSPEKVEIPFIKETARQQISGLFEWSYVERYKNEIPLNKIAHEILRILEEFEIEPKNQNSDSEFENFANTGNVEPIVIEIELKEKNYEKYVQLSKKAYSDIPCNIENLGGLNLLSDTNWEYNKQHLHNMETYRVKFYNASALHFKEINEEETISTMVKSGKITIESIKIG